MIFEKILILTQIAIIFSCIGIYGRGSNFTGRYFSPYNWFAFFIFFWFIIPQVMAVLPGHKIVGLDLFGEDTRRGMIATGQLAVLLYILSFSIAYFFFRMTFSKTLPVEPRFNALFLKKTDRRILFILLLVGVLCTLKLGLTFQAMDGMRSQLVKNVEGKILTALGFWGNFSFSVLFAFLLSRKRYGFSFMLLSVFASVILLTGARGRLLWPLLISAIFLSIYYRRFPVSKILFLGVLMLSVLVLLDPIMMAIKVGDLGTVVQHIESNNIFASLFFKRNFDSFSNLTLIVNSNNIPHEWTRLFTGARNAFMESYYPAAYRSGVGFGVTYPGTAFLSIGWAGIVLVGATLGLVCGYISRLVEKRLSVVQIFAYLTFMPWLCASGGNFIENSDKMIAAVLPALVWSIISKVKVR